MKFNPWGDKKKEALKKYYPLYIAGEVTAEDMEKCFGCTIDNLRRQAKKNGINLILENNYINDAHMPKLDKL